MSPAPSPPIVVEADEAGGVYAYVSTGVSGDVLLCHEQSLTISQVLDAYAAHLETLNSGAPA